MAVNLLSLTVDGIPIDQLKIEKNQDSVYELPLNFDISFPPNSDQFIDNPQFHVRNARGGYYPREKLYRNERGNTNADSNNKDGFLEVRRKELQENSSKPAIPVDQNLTKDIIENHIRSSKFSEYPRRKDFGPKDKPFKVWEEDRNINVILEDSYPSTCVNRGRTDISYNEELVHGKFFN